MKLVPAKVTTPNVPASATPRSWYDDIPHKTTAHKVGGYFAVALTVLGFGLWANTALISGAIVATGLFVTTGQNKTVQHLEGGVIKDILVREGDIVEPGQVLVRLDDTTPRAELRRLALRNALNTAKVARYMAEIQGDAEVDFPTDLVPKSAGIDIRDIDEIIDTQKLAFEARRKNVQTQIAALNDSINALQTRIDAGGLQEVSTKQQVDLIREEFASKSTLLPGGLIKKSELLALQRTEASLMGEMGRLGGDIGDAKARIARTKEEIAGVRATAIKDAVEQLHQVGADLVDVRERMRAAEGVLGRIEIKAPVRGRGRQTSLPHGRRRHRTGKAGHGNRPAQGRPCRRSPRAFARYRPRRSRPAGGNPLDRARPAHHADGTRPRYLCIGRRSAGRRQTGPVTRLLYYASTCRSDWREPRFQFQAQAWDAGRSLHPDRRADVFPVSDEAGYRQHEQGIPRTLDPNHFIRVQVIRHIGIEIVAPKARLLACCSGSSGRPG